jgi:hypothetical protein
MFKYCFKFIKLECARRAVELLDSTGSGYTIIRCEKVTSEKLYEIITGERRG